MEAVIDEKSLDGYPELFFKNTVQVGTAYAYIVYNIGHIDPIRIRIFNILDRMRQIGLALPAALPGFLGGMHCVIIAQFCQDLEQAGVAVQVGVKGELQGLQDHVDLF